MASIDDRIVNMQFNNADFQKNIGQSIDSIDTLNQKLNLSGATDGFAQVQSAANRFSLANMESALDNISSKFSVFGVSAFTIIQDLTNKILGFGAQIGNALISPIVDGGEVRAEALQKAQFQFRGLGLDIQATMDAAKNSVLGTAYSLDQAASAAGQLGASGVTAGNGLEGALSGIAGLAAQTGASYDSIAQIFTKVSGNGRLMGEDLLQLSANGVNAAATLAKAMGIPEAKVRELVTQGKISFQQFSDVMATTFGPNASKANELFSGALSNMRAALARLGAEFEGPKLLDLRDIFNAMSPFIDKVHAALLPLINDFNDIQNSGAATAVQVISNLLGPGLIASIQNIVQAIEAIGKAIGGGFREIFPENTASQLTAISVFLQNFTQALIPGTKAAEELKRTFAGLFAIFDILGQIIGTVVKTFFDLIGVAAPAGGSFLEITAKIGDFLVKVDDFLKKGQYLQNFFRTIGGIIAVPIAILRQFFGIIADGVKDLGLFNGAGKGLDNFADDLQNRFKGLAELGNFFNTVWQGVLDISKAVWGFLEPIFAKIGQGLAIVGNAIHDAFAQLTFDQGIKVLNEGILGGLSAGLLLFLNKFANIFQGGEITLGFKPLQTLVVQLKSIFTGLRVNLKALEINTNAKTLKEIAVSVALLAASAVAMSLVDPGKLGIAMGAITTQIAALVGAFAIFNKIGGTRGIVQSLALVTIIDGLAGAMLVLAGAVAILGALPIANLIQGTAALVVVLYALVGALAIMSKLGPGVLASAGAIAILAPAMAVLAGAIAILGALPLSNLVQGMVAFGIALAALVGALALLNLLGPEVLFGAGAIAIIAPALAILTGAIAALGALPFLNVVQGVGALVVTLAALAGAILLLGLAGPEALLGAVAIAAVALALIPLIGAIALLGAIPFLNLVQGMVAFTAALAILVGAVLLLGFTGPVALIGAAAIVAIALGIAVLAPALKLLSTISWDAIGRLLTILSAGLGILVVMGVLLIPASVGFLLLGVAILLIGTGIGAAAAGVGLLVVGLVALVAIGAGVFAILGLAIDTLITKLPALGAGIGAAIVAMAVVIGQDAPQLVVAFVQLLTAMLTAVDQIVPQLIVVATDIIVALINALVILIPLLVDAGLAILEGVLQGISDHIGRIAELAILIIANFINGIAAGLPALLQAGANLILSFINGLADTIRNNHADLDRAIANLADALTGGLSTGITQGAGKVIRAITGIANDAINAAKRLLGIHSPSKVFDEEIGQQMGAGMGNGIIKSTAAVVNAARDMGTQSTDAVQNAIAGLGDSFGDNVDIQPTIRPIVDLSNINTASKQVAGLLQPPTLSLSTSKDVAQSVSLQEQARNAQIVLDSSRTNLDGQGDVTFIQNNTSPKALSPTELYRQTRNQLSILKGDLGVVDQSGSS